MKQRVQENKWWFLSAVFVYALTFVFNLYSSKSASVETLTKDFSNRIDDRLNNFKAFYNDTSCIRHLRHFQLQACRNSVISSDKTTFYYLYTDSPNGMQLQYWSNATIVPPPDAIPYSDTVKLVKLENGWYIMASHKLPNSLLTAIQLILVKQEYYTKIISLKAAFPGHPGLEENIALRNTPTPYVVKAKNTGPLFYLSAKGNGPLVLFNWPSMLVQLLATLLLLVFFNRVGTGLAFDGHPKKALLWMVGTIILVRLSIPFLSFPVNVYGTALFEPIAKGNFFFRSVGGLLLNLLLFIWLMYFLLRTTHIWLLRAQALPPRSQKVIAMCSILLVLLSSFAGGLLIIKLALLPEATFDIANFLNLHNWKSPGAVACLYFLCVLHYRLLFIATNVYNKLMPGNALFKFLLTAIAGIALLFILIGHAATAELVIVLLWLLLSLLMYDAVPHLFQNVEQSVQFAFWLIWYAIAASVLVHSQHSEKQKQEELVMARSLANNADSEVVTRMSAALKDKNLADLEKQPLLTLDSAYNQYLRRKIVQAFTNNLGGYTTRIYFYDSTCRPLFNTDSTSCAAFNTIIQNQSQATPANGIYLYQSTYDRFSYIVKKRLQQDSLHGGYLFLTCSPSNFNEQALVPEVFRPLRADAQTSYRYDFAVYDKDVLFRSTGSFPFTTHLAPTDKLRGEVEIKKRNGRKTLWYNGGQQRIIVIVPADSLYYRSIMLFAYIFGCFILLYLLESFLARLLTGRFRLPVLRLFRPASIRSNIRRTVIAISSVSFLLIGIATVYFYVQRFHLSNSNRLNQLIVTVRENLQYLGEENLFNQQQGSAAKGYTSNHPSVQLIAGLLHTEINLFDLQGNLTATSEPLLYEQSIISTKMNAEAYYHMAVLHQVQFLQQEAIANLTYQGIYVPVRPDGITIGYINIPLFASQTELNREISGFLVTLINLIAFIFIIAGIASYFITNSITASFYNIGQKMKAISLGKVNEPITWNRNDEIGILVQQYNKMLEQLDESAHKLARSEREFAWREMAKQVAHEIKNPLTPMKLNLQYLQRQLEVNPAGATEMAKRMTVSLVEQIDHLNQIASDFSQLARINVSRTEKFDVHQVLHQLVMLYQTDPTIQLTWEKEGNEAMIEADRTQINRLFTNLLKNGIEAAANTKAVISIRETIDEWQQTITVAITDNGTGIPEEKKEQIFMPNFTTKSSGTGLGLAICKDIAERAGGAIWFESKPGGPTTFMVRLPLATV